MTNLYEILDVAPDADAEQIKQAYRRAAQRTHPDREGGSDQAFQEVQEAYQVLSDPERRAQYDVSGSTAPLDAVQMEARGQLAELFIQMVDRFDMHVDFRSKMEDGVRSSIAHAAETIRQQRAKLERREKVLKRLSRADDAPGPDMLRDRLTAQNAHDEAQIKSTERHIVIMQAMLEELKFYGYDTQVEGGGYATYASPAFATRILL